MLNDYITLMLINMAAGLTVLAFYICKGMDSEDQRSWAAAFLAPGLVALATGLHMTLTWPIKATTPDNLTFANSAFGEMTVLMGVVFLSAALALARGWSLKPLAVYAFLAGVVAIVVGVRLAQLGKTLTPYLTGIGFMLSGLGGVLIGPVLCMPRDRYRRALLTLVLLAAAFIWTLTACVGYWGNMKKLSSPSEVQKSETRQVRRGRDSPWRAPSRHALRLEGPGFAISC